MSPKTPDQNKLIRQKKEEQIIEAALMLFSEYGFASTSMQSVAREAGVSKGNLYNYFVSKEELLQEVLQNGMDLMMQSFSEYDELRDENQFAKIIHANFKMIRDFKNFWKLYYNLVAQPKVHVLFSKILQPFYEQYMNLFEAYYKNKGEKKPMAIALLLGSTLDGISLAYTLMGDEYPLQEVVDQLIDKYK